MFNLSHVRSTDWHYKIISTIWENKTQGKACTYYWFKLPLSFLAWLLMIILMALYGVVGGLFGYVTTAFRPDQKDERMMRYYRNKLFYPYKTLPNGKKFRLAPWEVVAAVGLLYGLYYLAFINHLAGLLLLGGAIGISLLGVGAFLVTKGWDTPLVRQARTELANTWDRVCPDLVVVEPAVNDDE